MPCFSMTGRKTICPADLVNVVPMLIAGAVALHMMIAVLIVLDQKAIKLAIQSGLSNWELFLENGARSSGRSFFQKMFAKQDFPG